MNRVKALRQLNKLSQLEMANAIGVSPPSYSKKENGDVKFSLTEAQKISKIFGETIEDIFLIVVFQKSKLPVERGEEHKGGSDMKKATKADREQTTLRLPAELKEELQREAAEMGVSFNAYVLTLIDRGRQGKRGLGHAPAHSPQQPDEGHAPTSC